MKESEIQRAAQSIVDNIWHTTPGGRIDLAETENILTQFGIRCWTAGRDDADARNATAMQELTKNRNALMKRIEYEGKLMRKLVAGAKAMEAERDQLWTALAAFCCDCGAWSSDQKAITSPERHDPDCQYQEAYKTIKAAPDSGGGKE